MDTGAARSFSRSFEPRLKHDRSDRVERATASIRSSSPHRKRDQGLCPHCIASEERRNDFLMKAAVIHALEQPPRFEDFPEPTAGEGEVGVNVRAPGLNPFFRAKASGSQSRNTNGFPKIPRIDELRVLDDGTLVY